MYVRMYVCMYVCMYVSFVLSSCSDIETLYYAIRFYLYHIPSSIYPIEEKRRNKVVCRFLNLDYKAKRCLASFQKFFGKLYLGDLKVQVPQV